MNNNTIDVFFNSWLSTSTDNVYAIQHVEHDRGAVDAESVTTNAAFQGQRARLRWASVYMHPSGSSLDSSYLD